MHEGRIAAISPVAAGSAAGASAFPQNGGYNPTGTVGALTLQAIRDR